MKMAVIFVMGTPERRRFSYVGWQVEQEQGGTITVSQEGFLRNLEEVDRSQEKDMKVELSINFGKATAKDIRQVARLVK